MSLTSKSSKFLVPIKRCLSFAEDVCFRGALTSLQEFGIDLKDVLDGGSKEVGGHDFIVPKMDTVFFHHDRFEVLIDARGFRPEDVRCRVTSNLVEVVANKQERSEYASRGMSLARNYQLPKPVIPVHFGDEDKPNNNMESAGIKPLDINTDVQNIGSRWNKWIARFENYTLAANITSSPRKKAQLLHMIGDDVFELYHSLPDLPNPSLETTVTQSTPTSTPDLYEMAKNKLAAYFSPRTNTDFEIFNFRNARQEYNETIDQFYARLLKLAKTCNFNDQENEIKSRIILNTTDSELRKFGLKEQPLLGKLLEHGRTIEATNKRIVSIEHNFVSQPVHFLKHQKHRDHSKKQLNYNQQCLNCGSSWHKDGKNACPAKLSICNNCGKQGHFAKVCMSKSVNRNFDASKQQKQFSEHKSSKTSTSGYQRSSKHRAHAVENSSSDEECFNIRNFKDTSTPKVNLIIESNTVLFTIDSGSTVNIISKKTYDSFSKKPPLDECATKIFPYNSNKCLPVSGVFSGIVSYKYCTAKTEMFVVDGEATSLLSFNTAIALGLLHISYMIETETIKKQYPELFEGIGKLKDLQVHLYQDKSITPVAQKHRRIPFHLRDLVETELERLENADIIEKVNTPTPWVSPVVIVPKPHNSKVIRICIDMGCPNKAIKRIRHVTPTIDDIMSLNGAKFFSKLDLNDGYHQLVLDDESRSLTTFSTHMGLFRYKRLNFGVNAAAEIFQDTIRQVLVNIPGVFNVSDDILVFGATENEHDATLHKVLKRLSESGLTLNERKCSFKQNKIKFFGYIFSDEGIFPDQSKIEALTELMPPKNITELRSFLGMLNYLGKFQPHLASNTHILRNLLQKEVPWIWGKEHDRVFEYLKKQIVEAHKLVYFDVTKTIHLYVDAGPCGLGAILTQGDNSTQVVAFGSRSLTAVEQRWSQIEKEMIAVTWAIEHFHIYLFGSKFVLHTDHKPLVSILQKPTLVPSARLERLRLRIQHYEFTVEHQKGITNPADYLSRHPLKQTSLDERKSAVVDEYINFIIESSIPKALSLNEVRDATRKDETLQKVISLLDANKLDHPCWKEEDFLLYKKIFYELTVNDDILLRNNRIVVPKSLITRCIQLAHRGHMGIVKTKQLLRSKVWFPKIDQLVEEKVRHCPTCQILVDTKTRDPLVMTKLPMRPWQVLDIDFAGPYPTGEYLLLIVDEHSRYPIVEIISSLNAKTVTRKLRYIFAQFGIPDILKSDNGAPFNSHDFAEFATEMNFSHHKVTPYWPEANGLAERSVKTFKKIVLSSKLENKSLREELDNFLINYRATKHSVTEISPFEVIFGRPIKTTLPILFNEEENQEKINEANERNKWKQKDYADKRRSVKNHILNIGDTVLCKQPKLNKFSTPYDPKPYQVVRILGNQITAEREGNQVVRNSSFFKKFYSSRTNTTSSMANKNTEVTKVNIQGNNQISKSAKFFQGDEVENKVPEIVENDIVNNLPKDHSKTNEDDEQEDEVREENRLFENKRTRKRPDYLKDFVTE